MCVDLAKQLETEAVVDLDVRAGGVKDINAIAVKTGNRAVDVGNKDIAAIDIVNINPGAAVANDRAVVII